MRGTQWKAFIDKAINTMENHPKDTTLLQNLGVDRLASLALRVVEAFPQYSESHPETTQRFLSLVKEWPFRSHIEFLHPEEIQALVEEYNLQL